jgi:hypothetical protein
MVFSNTGSLFALTAKRLAAQLVAIVAVTLALSCPSRAQTAQPQGIQPQIAQSPEGQLGRITGTVTDAKGEAIVGATVLITGPDSSDRRSIVTGQNGYFEIDGLKPGIAYEIAVSDVGFDPWTSPAVVLAPGQFKLMGDISLRLATQQTTVSVTYNPVQVARQQLKQEEKQRVLGIVPNFHVSYEGEDAAHLTAKMKFQLAFKVSYDPVTIAGVALVSASRQALNSPKYGQGWGPYGERFGAVAVDGFTDIMIGAAILPSLLHEDPRYFYQGTGSTKSRLRHAILSPFIGRHDNGTWGINYSSLGGDLGSAAISNVYFPRSDRGADLVFSQFALGTAERVGASLAQEFLIGKFTTRGGHLK